MPKGIYNRKNIEHPRIFTARESFTTMLDGTQISVLKGVTVREGHQLLLGREHLFVPQHVDYEIELTSEPEPDVPDPTPSETPVSIPTPAFKLKTNK